MLLYHNSDKRGNMANDEMYTPNWIFEALKTEFDLDVASPENGTGIVPAKQFYSIKDNGLIQPWHGLVWMNPPYSKPSPWVDKWLSHQNGLALLPLSGNSKWFRKLWLSDCEVILITPNTSFLDPTGLLKTIWVGLTLWATGNRAKKILHASNLGFVR
jgi:hypothetical protein